MIKFFGINTRTGKVLRDLPIRWEFPSPGWVKINTDGAARGYPIRIYGFKLEGGELFKESFSTLFSLEWNYFKKTLIKKPVFKT